MWPKLGPVPTYSVFYLAGILLYFLLTIRPARRAGFSFLGARLFGLAYALAMIVGARVAYEVARGHVPAALDLLSPSFYTQGGLWGGPLVFLPLLGGIAWLNRPRYAATLDVGTRALPLPMALVKLGCLANGCCFGRPCPWPWGVTFPPGTETPSGVPLHPTQLYEFAVLLVCAVVLYALDRPRWRGTLVLWFLVLYGGGRALTEVWRGDLVQRVHWGGLATSQVLCLAAAAVSAVALVVIARRRRPTAAPLSAA